MSKKLGAVFAGVVSGRDIDAGVRLAVHVVLCDEFETEVLDWGDVVWLGQGGKGILFVDVAGACGPVFEGVGAELVDFVTGFHVEVDCSALVFVEGSLEGRDACGALGVEDVHAVVLSTVGLSSISKDSGDTPW